MRREGHTLHHRVFGSRELRYRTQMLAEAVASFLVNLILWCGCFVTHPLGREPRGGRILPGDKFLIVRLGKDDFLEVCPFCYVEVRAPSDFIYGSGVMIDNENGHEREFNGRIEPGTPFRFEAGGRTGKLRSGDSGRSVYYFRISDRHTVRLGEGCFVRVTPEGGTGLWCAGTRVKDHKRSPFSGRIPFDQIRGINENSITVGTTLKIGLAVCIAIAVLVGFLLVKIFGV
jgi:hypothetical protein